MNNHEFDDIIKQKAQQREADVPGDIWESIAGEKKKRRRPFFWLIFLMCCLGGLGLMINSKIREHRIPELTTVKTKTDKLVSGRTNEQGKNAGINNSQSGTSIKKINNIELGMLDSNSIFETKEPVHAKIRSANGLNTADDGMLIIDKPNAIDRTSNDVKNNSSIRKTKSTYVATEDKINVSGITKTFAASRKRKKIKADYKVNIHGGETEADKIKTDNNSNVASAVKQTNHSNENNITYDALVTKQNQHETVVITELKTSKPTDADSTMMKKIIDPLKDTATKKNFARNVVIKEKGKMKNTGLKIEAALIVVSPMQYYDQPIHIKRSLNTASFQADFVSDHFESTIEQGSGISIHLVKAINKKTDIGAGFTYLRFTEKLHMKGIQSKTSFTTVQRLVTDATGSFLKEDTVSVVSKDSITLNGRNVYQNLTLPVFIRYRILNRSKWTLSVTGGINVDLIRAYHNDIPGKFETVYTNRTVSTDSRSTIGLGLSAGLHFSGVLYKKYQWLAATSFNYNLTPYTTNNLSFNKRIHLPGILFGVSYQLKK